MTSTGAKWAGRGSPGLIGTASSPDDPHSTRPGAATRPEHHPTERLRSPRRTKPKNKSPFQIVPVTSRAMGDKEL